MIGRKTPLERSSALNRRSNVNSKSNFVSRSAPHKVPAERGRANVSATSLSNFEEQVIRKVLSATQDFMDSPEFHKRGAAKRIYKENPEIGLPDVSWYRPLMDTATASRNTRTPKRGMTLVLTADQERTLFLKFNYARFMISRIQTKLDGRLPDMDTKQEILAWNSTATRYREQIAETNLALVLAMAKRTRMNEIDFGDLVSEGNMALMRSVDKFDCERGFKFSTYACRAILKAFSRHGMKMSKYRQRFPAEFDPAFEKSDHLATTRATHDQECADEVKHIVMNNDADLSDVELAVIEHRFGLGNDAEEPARKTLTLEQVGQIIGVTKERVRQIQNKALAKIKCALEEVAPPGSPAVTAN
jgi:RNA polymerase sigma factor (sigma-70 family)